MAYHKINYGTNNLNDPTKPNNSTNNASSNQSNSNSGNIMPTNFNTFINSNDVPEQLIDYHKLAKEKKIHKVKFRESITQKMLTKLDTKYHPNVILIGDAGVGKTAIVEDLAVRLYEKDPLITALLDDETKIYELPLSSLVEGSSYRGQLEAKLKEVIDFVTNPDNKAILYLDEIHQLKRTPELSNVADILKPLLSRSDLHVIGSTTTQEIKYMNQDPAFQRRFGRVFVPELTDEQTFEVLKDILPSLNKHKVQVDDTTLRHVIKTGNKYSKSLNTNRPDSAITILDESLSTAKLQSILLNQNAQLMIPPVLNTKIIDKASNQLVNNDMKLENNTALKLQTRLDDKIIGQDNAKTQLVNIIKSKILDLSEQKTPNSLLFAGPTGTGKTEIAKQLAKTLFNSKDRIIYLNMTEYANQGSITRLIGSSRGYIGSESTAPLPLDKLRSNPFQIVLLDEFEKANQDVQRVFMQALDEGYIRYADETLVDFSQAIVIATTNAGSEKLNKTSVGFGQTNDISNDELNNALLTSFPPELLNRFEHIVNFTAITKEQYAQILCIKYNELIKSIHQNKPTYQIQPEIATPDMKFILDLVEKSYDKTKNGRPAKRTIRKFIESAIFDDPTTYKLTFDTTTN